MKAKQLSNPFSMGDGVEDTYIAKRIFEASFDDKRKIPHLSVSTYGEMVG